MSYPKKRRGWRPIDVGERHYKWKLWPSSPNSKLVVTGTMHGGQRLEVTLRGWQDPWLAIFGLQVEEKSLTLLTDAVNTLPVIASGFVREMIEFGLNHGWDPEGAAPPLYVEYDDSRPAFNGSAVGGSGRELIAPEDPHD